MVLVEIILMPPSEVLLVFVPPAAVVEKNKKPEPIKFEQMLQDPQAAFRMFMPSEPSKLGMKFTVNIHDFFDSKRQIGDTFEFEM